MILESGFELVAGTSTIDSNYIDNNTVFQIEKREIKLGEYIVVLGDNNSEVISFEHDRYVEGIDLSTKQIEFIYERPDGVPNTSKGMNFRRSEVKVRFSWLIDSDVSCVAGQVKFVARFFENNYSLKTIDSEITVRASMSSEVSPTIPVYGEMQFLTLNEISEIMIEVKAQIAYGG